MSTTFARLEGLSSRLNETSEELNEAISNLESKFGALNLNLTVWVKEPFLIEEKKEGSGELKDVARAYFGYAKINDAWRLWIRKEDVDANGEGEGEQGTPRNYTPLYQAPREFRVKALQQIPQLVTELENQTEALLEEVETAKMIAEMVSS